MKTMLLPAAAAMILLSASITFQHAVPSPMSSTEDVTITIENCSCPTCPVQKFPDMSCQPDPYMQGGHREVQCMNSLESCAHLVLAHDAECKNTYDTVTVICGKCMRSRRNHTMHEFISCDLKTEAVTISEECDEICKVCNKPNAEVHPFDTCSKLSDGRSVYNQGVTQCDAVTITHFNSSACTGDWQGRFWAGQYECSHDERIACSKPVPVPIPEATHVTESICPMGSRCTRCNDTTVPTGKCIASSFPGHSRVITCGTVYHSCADLAHYENKDCTGFIGTMAPVCGSCAVFGNASMHTKITCDEGTQSVSLSHNCNRDCSLCDPAEVVPFHSCAASPHGNHTSSTFHRGLFPCSTVTVRDYVNEDCSGDPDHEMVVAEDRCEMNGRYECGSPFTVPPSDVTITIENCSCPECPVQKFPDMSCQPDPYMHGGHREVQCMNSLESCAHLVLAHDAECKNTFDTVTVICGKCMRSRRNRTMHEFISCDLKTEAVTISEECDEICKVCNKPNAEVHPFDTCTKLNDGRSVYNQGVTQCDAVTITHFNSSACTGDWQGRFWAGQYECSHDERIACSKPVPVPIPEATHVTESICPMGSRCTRCNDTTVPTGKCIASSFPGHSRVITCGTVYHSCADLAHYENKDCTGFIGTMAPVCGSCAVFGNASMHTKITCDEGTQSVSLSHNCNRDCSLCDPAEVVPFHSCAASPHGNHMSSMFHRGLFPCSTVTVRDYVNEDCSGDPDHEMVVAEDRCEMNGRYECGSPFTVPPSDVTITIENCSCPECPVQKFPDMSCQPDPYMHGHREVQCMNSLESCAHLVLAHDTECKNTFDASTVICGKCMRSGRNRTHITHEFISCDLKTEAVTISEECDEICKICNKPNAVVFAFDTCTKLSDGRSVYNQGVTQCDAVTITHFNSSACTGDWQGRFWAGQYECSHDERIACSKPVPVPIPEATHVTESICPMGSRCTRCNDTTVPTGKCIASSFPGHSRVITCGTVYHSCADLAHYENKDCTGFIGTMAPVCGSCAVFGNASMHTKITCDEGTQSVSLSHNCNRDCSLCDPAEVVPFHSCAASPHGNHMSSTFHRGLFPCSTVTVRDYVNEDCSGDPDHEMVVAEDRCEMNGRYECGSPFTVPPSDVTITIENCSCPECPVQKFPDMSCQPDPYMHGGHREVQCMNSLESCAHLVLAHDTECKNTFDASTVICGKCMRSGRNRTHITHEFISCDLKTEAVTISEECDEICKICNKPNAVVFAFDTCTKLSDGRSVYNQGVTQCDAVTITHFNSSACTGDWQGRFWAGQYECSHDERIACSKPVPVPIPEATHVTESICPMGSRCTRCNDTTVPTGKCIASSFPGHSRVITCGTVYHSCADLAHYENKDCTGFIGTMAPVCGSCAVFGNASMHTKITCDEGTQSVSLSHNCNRDCSLCDPAEVVPFHSCAASPHGNHMSSTFHRGLFPCSTVTVRDYVNEDCSGDPDHEMVVAEDRCEMNGRYECGSPFTVPPSDVTITIENCSCPECPVQKFPDMSCQPDPYMHGGHREVQCMNSLESCAHLVLAHDTECKNTFDASTVICGKCMRSGRNRTHITHEFISCDLKTEAVTISEECDEICKICNKPNAVVFAFDTCTKLSDGRSVYNQGVTQCDAVTITHFNSSACTGDWQGRFWAGQYECSHDERIACSKPVPVPIPEATHVTESICPMGSRCTRCNDTTVPTGTCVSSPIRGHSRVINCGTVYHSCADLAHYENKDCTGFIGTMAPVCGSCARFGNASMHTKITCDEGTQSVSLSHNCNRDCSLCDPAEVVPFHSCAASPHGNHMSSTFHRGLFPCSTVTVRDYVNEDCSGDPDHEMVVAEDRCEMNGRYECGSPFTVPPSDVTITIENCSCPTCPVQKFPDMSCQPDPYMHGGHREVQCMNSLESCAHLVLAHDAECKNTFDAVTVICGKCMRSRRNHTMHEFFSCDLKTEAVTISEECDEICKICNKPNAEVHPFDTCSKLGDGRSVYNQGVTQCDAVTITHFNSSACTGDWQGRFWAGQYECSHDERIACSKPVPVPIPEATHVTESICPMGSRCTRCNDTTVPTGKCVASSFPGHSRVITCGTVYHSCADLAHYENKDCTGFIGTMAPVCGSCARFGNASMHTKITCDEGTQSVSLSHNCNRDCSLCDPAEVVPFHSCAASPHGNHMSSMFHRGLFPCSTVTVRDYVNEDCSGDPDHEMVVAEDRCEMNGRYECGSPFTVPPSDVTITIENCSCPTCPVQKFPDMSCQPDPYMHGHREVQCMNSLESCAHLVLAHDAECKNTFDTVTVICGKCMRSRRNHTMHEFFSCDLKTEAVTISEECDEICKICNKPNAEVHPFDTCSKLGDGRSVYNQGVTQCDAVTITHFNSSACTGDWQGRFWAGQYECSHDERIACSKPVPVPIPEATHVTESICPMGSRCTRCNDTTVPTGKCIASSFPGHSRVITCGTVYHSCADLAHYENKDCTGFIGTMAPVCGSCARFGNASMHTKITCDEGTQSVSLSHNCNRDCSLCDPAEVVPFHSCAASPHGNHMSSTFHRGLFPCSTVTVRDYVNEDCSGDPDHEMVVAEDRCEMNGRYECGSPFTVPPSDVTITIENCSCPECPVQKFPDMSCQPDPYMHGGHREVQCMNSLESCAHLVLSSDPECKNTYDTVTVICGKCMRSRRNHTMREFMACDLKTETVTVSEECDEICKVCKQPNKITFPFDTCTKMTDGQRSVYSQGVTQCDAVTITHFNSSACTGDWQGRFWAGQYECSNDERIACSKPVPVPIPEATHVTESICPMGSRCTRCNDTTVPTGKCIASSFPGHSRVITCGTVYHSCADLAHYENKDCTGFIGTMAPVCGSCARFGNAAMHTKITCDEGTQSVSLSHNCNRDCSQCDPAEVVPFHSCAASPHGNHTSSTFHRGLFPCSTVTVRDYVNEDCSGDPDHEMVVAEDRCEMNGRYECGSPFTVPPFTEPTKPPGPSSSRVLVIAVVCAGVTCCIAVALFFFLRSSHAFVRVANKVESDDVAGDEMPLNVQTGPSTRANYTSL